MSHALLTTLPARRPSRNPLPFAAVPHVLAEDERLKPIDLAVTRAILKHARGDDHAWPSVATLARQVGRTRRTVQFALRRLESTGWIAAEPAENPTGRVLVLTWRRDGGATPGAGEAPSMAPPPAQASAPDQDVPVKRLKDQEPKASPFHPRSRTRSIPSSALIPVSESRKPSVISPAQPAACSIPVLTPAVISPSPILDSPARTPAATPTACTRRRPRWAADPELVEAASRTADPILSREVARQKTCVTPAVVAPEPTTTSELLMRVREAPQHPAAAAEMLAREFADRKSWPGFLARCREAWDGRRSPNDLAEAYRMATAPGARNPGAIFMAALKKSRN